ncbi:MFS transporter [Ferdinandcohnia quinoae]|uniref:MFS transporter n=1 Tax=Fredinandcohnia quinoae TaxID=2918902 RepID=A0AAW5E3V6_9BACI|nr:MFS transporter [Fredinandcohnia sp. SECRCQ15]MCH1627158.1 MFS transporter [Fredinandcohnia sp. SECRCQ15]
MKKTEKWGILSLSSIPLVMTLGNSMLIPVLPVMEKELDISPFQSSLIITSYSIVAIVLIPIAGFLSDKIGRKKVIIPSLILAGIGGLISAFAAWKLSHPYILILIGRLFQGIGAAGAAPIVLPLVGDMCKSEKDVNTGLGLIETSNTLGKVLSPILGALLASFLWYLPFVSIPIFCLISVILIQFIVKTPKDNEVDTSSFSLFLKKIKRILVTEGRWLISIFIIGGICMYILFGMLFYLSSILEDSYGIDGVKKGLILAIPLGVLCLASYITGKKLGENKNTMKWIIFLGIISTTVSVLGITYTKNIYILITALIISGIGIGISLPSLDALITNGIEKDQRGTITSIYSSARFIGVALGPPTFVILLEISHKALFITVTCISAFATILALFFIKPPKKIKTDSLFQKLKWEK